MSCGSFGAPPLPPSQPANMCSISPLPKCTIECTMLFVSSNEQFLGGVLIGSVAEKDRPAVLHKCERCCTMLHDVCKLLGIFLWCMRLPNVKNSRPAKQM